MEMGHIFVYEKLKWRPFVFQACIHRPAVEFPSLEVFKTQLNTALSSWLRAGAWGRSSPEVPPDLNWSVIL